MIIKTSRMKSCRQVWSIEWNFRGWSIRRNFVVDEGLKCLVCERTSWDKNDVKNRYCGNCHQYHDIMEKKLSGTIGLKRTRRERKFLDGYTKKAWGIPLSQAEKEKICVACHEPIGEFKDELSRKENSISGTCQECQDIQEESECRLKHR